MKLPCMYTRINKLPKDHHFFLFGARGVGKSTLLHHIFEQQHCLWIDLLDLDEEARFSRDPMLLESIILALPSSCTHIVIDEIQKIPKLLDVVHRLIENPASKQFFILTGSSARKLKRGGANLLAGRAFVYHLFPLSFLELGEQFQLNAVLSWGTLPKIYQLQNPETKQKFLNAYAHTYLKEEIWGEQFIKKLDPFRYFLEVAAQNNGKIINHSNIARNVNVTDMTVKEYYQILEDTLIGFHLPAFKHSFRKRLGTKSKFYFFDTGVARALCRALTIPVQIGTSYYGDLFEHFIITECMKFADYYNLDYRFSYLQTHSGVEIDLIVDRPGKPYLFIEIKSDQNVAREKLNNLRDISLEIGNCEAVCFSQDKYAKRFDTVLVLPWQEGIKRYFSNAGVSH